MDKTAQYTVLNTPTFLIIPRLFRLLAVQELKSNASLDKTNEESFSDQVYLQVNKAKYHDIIKEKTC